MSSNALARRMDAPDPAEEENMPTTTAGKTAEPKMEARTADRIRAGIARYRTWERHRDAGFLDAAETLQQAQIARLRRTHADSLADARFQPITEFFLSEIYTGLDLEELAREIEKALPVATRMLPDSVMRTAATAVELNALTGELDEEVVRDLIAHGQAENPSDADIVAAYRRCGHYDQRREQMRLLRELGLGLDRYVRSRLITATFKMASRPAHMAGLGGLYDFMGQGFAVMKPMKSVADFLDTFIGREQRILDVLENSDDDPFADETAHD